MKIKKIFYLIAVALIFTNLLVGCTGSNSTNTNKPDETAQNEDNKVIETKEPVKISILTQDTYDPNWPQSKGLPVIKELEARTNVIIDFQCINVSQLANTVQTRLAASSNLPDIVSVGSVPVTTLFNLGKQGVILELTDLIDKHAPNLKSTYKEHPEFKDWIVAPDGKIYWINYVQALETEAYNGIWIRKDWLDNVNFGKLPETIDEFYEAIKAIQEGDANKNGKKDEVYLPYQWWQFEMTLPTSFGVPENGWNVDENGKVYMGRLTEGYKNFLMFANKLYEERLTDPDVVTIPWDKYFAKVQSNIVIGGWNVPRALEWAKSSSNNGDCDIEFLPPLKGPDGKSLNVKGGVYGGGYYAITKNCKNVEAVMKFLDYIYSPEGEMLCKYGIEGTHYTKTADGKIERTQAYKDGVKDPSYYWSQGFGFGTSLPLKNIQNTEEFIEINKEAYKKLGMEPDILRNIMNRYKQNVVQPYPYLSMLEEEAKALEAIGTDWSKYIDEMIVKFFMGKESFDNWDEFVKETNKLGAAKAAEIEQRKYDRWKSRKK